ncbi:hypothetical protein [Streptomyces sp. WAC01280]|uniref:hypothetical protein n=1 Tax=Streptomyces sp. WAC01280 TaxID=2487424 RepID=UPI000F7AB004|nr:hypothetical protein [Streptomyces sp. WAC01280]RSS57477.1 hypothetical protein EF909_16170 [Streptomyces sp. WAC01280]
MAAVVAAVISQDDPTPSGPTTQPGLTHIQTTAAPTTGPQAVMPTAPVANPTVDGRVTGQSADPGNPPAGIIVHFEGKVTGLEADSTVYAMVKRSDSESNWPVALADVDRRSGKWTAHVPVPDPTLPVAYQTGVISTADDGIPHAGPPPTALERLQRQGPDAGGITTSTPFRLVPPTPASS